MKETIIIKKTDIHKDKLDLYGISMDGRWAWVKKNPGIVWHLCKKTSTGRDWGKLIGNKCSKCSEEVIKSLDFEIQLEKLK